MQLCQLIAMDKQLLNSQLSKMHLVLLLKTSSRRQILKIFHQMTTITSIFLLRRPRALLPDKLVLRDHGPSLSGKKAVGRQSNLGLYLLEPSSSPIIVSTDIDIYLSLMKLILNSLELLKISQNYLILMKPHIPLLVFWHASRSLL